MIEKAKLVDPVDMLYVLGMTCLGTGVWMLFGIPVALITVGTVLVTTAVVILHGIPKN